MNIDSKFRKIVGKLENQKGGECAMRQPVSEEGLGAYFISVIIVLCNLHLLHVFLIAIKQRQQRNFG
jgi:hypothetical protein